MSRKKYDRWNGIVEALKLRDKVICHENGLKVVYELRKCLGYCGEMFPSRSEFNRICPECKSPKRREEV